MSRLYWNLRSCSHTSSRINVIRNLSIHKPDWELNSPNDASDYVQCLIISVTKHQRNF